MKPDLIIFDCDGVLVDSETIQVAVELELLAELGLSYDYVDYLTRFVGLGGSEWHRAVAEDLRLHGLGNLPADFSWAPRFTD